MPKKNRTNRNKTKIQTEISTAICAALLIEMASIEPASFTFLLFFIYLSIILVSLFQIARIIFYGHNIWGWQFGFLALCIPFAALRCLFFLLFDVLSEVGIVLFFALYWIPSAIQFATFSLLVLFYAHIYWRTEKQWEKKKTRYVLTFVLCNVFYIMITYIAIVIVAVSDTQSNWENRMWNSLQAMVFTVLVSVLAFYGVRVAGLMRAGKTQISFQPKKSSNLQVISVTAIIFLLFTSRAIFNMLSASQAISLTVSSGLSVNDMLVFVLFVLWEIVPTTLVIILFWRIPSPKRSAQLPNTQAVPYKVGMPKEKSRNPLDGAAQTTSLFDNPQRYDSDEDVISYSPSPRFFMSSNSPYSPYDINPTPPSYGVLAGKFQSEDKTLSSS